MTAIIFDLDGTLIDSAPEIRAIANGILHAEGAAPLDLAETRNFIGNGAGVFVSRMMEARAIDAAEHPRLLEAFLARYETATDNTQLYPGVIEALTHLAEAGHHMAICTNKPEAPARHILAHFGLEWFFDAVVGGDSLPVRKPDPAPLQAAIDALGRASNLYVGDSEVDFETASNAGVPFALFTEGYRKSDLEPVGEAMRFSGYDAFAALTRRHFEKA